ncbi:MAG: DUF930 domain-containing protein [Hyphomicrobiales bacterium]|nr:DUF930 domain-containing protein [Hyphomicrobiales bacterium]
MPVSLAVHLLAVALLIFGLPISLPHPQEDQAISVDLVPPPMPPEKPKAPPEPPEEKPAPEKTDKTGAETPPPVENSAVRPTPIPTLRPVFQFGDKDAGPRKSLAGNSAEDAAKASTAHDDPDKEAPAEIRALTATGARSVEMQPAAPEKSSRTEKPVETQDKVKLQEAKKLFSRSITDDPRATTAMRNMPRDERGGWLCVTELREQLRNASPPYFPDILPAYRLTHGTAMDIPKAAFRTGGQWYDLSYRCKVDKKATRVESFSLHVGEPIPQDEWARRGLPTQ